ncbi:TLD-domain-containing protein [Schizophyllum commune]
MASVAPTSSQGGAWDDEAAFDKFATLFSPATPRASPTPEGKAAMNAPPVAQRRPPPIATFDSEFGSFVPVSANEDPLSFMSSSPSVSTLPPPIQPSVTPRTPQVAAHPATTTGNVKPNHTRANPSLDFFDAFGREAKEASERNKRQVLDELLLHDSDPLCFLAPPCSSVTSFSPSLIDFDPLAEPEKPATLADDVASTSTGPHHHHHHHHHVGSPTRQSTLTPSTLAPPLTSSSSVSSKPATPAIEHPPEFPFPSSSPPPRSQSMQTLSGLSSSWLSTIREHGLSSILPATHTRQATDPGRTLPGHPNPHPHTPGHTPTQPVTITHNTPFTPTGPAHSPFAAHVYIPPSGAPGFRGEAYDWDKGYSVELERELQASGASSRGLGGVVLTGRNPNTEVVLTNETADSIRPYLPALARLPRTWSLLYSLDQHGISLATLYRKCEAALDARRTSGNNTGALVVIKDGSGTVFGAWVGDGIHPSKGQGFYGSGESFLWKKVEGGKCRVYKWTGKNNYVTLCEPEYISFGGGDGQYGIYLDESLFDGSSARCPTFDNDPLCSPGARKGRAVQFECVGLEVWGVGT